MQQMISLKYELKHNKRIWSITRKIITKLQLEPSRKLHTRHGTRAATIKWVET